MTTQREAELELENLRLRKALGLNEPVRNPKYPWRPSRAWENCPACFERFDLDTCDHCGSGYADEYIPATPPSTEALASLVEKVEKLTLLAAAECAVHAGALGRDGTAYKRIVAMPTGNIKLEDLLK